MRIVLSESQKIWNRVYITGGDYKDDGVVSKTEILMMDKTTNSLKQLNKYVDAIAQVMIAKHEREKAEASQILSDTTIKFTPPAGIKDTEVVKPPTP